MLQTELAVKKRRVKVGETRADRAFDIMNYVFCKVYWCISNFLLVSQQTTPLQFKFLVFNHFL